MAIRAPDGANNISILIYYMLNVISIMLTFRNCEQTTFWKSLFESPAEQPGGAEMCYQTRDYSPSHLSKFVNLGVDH